MNAGSYDKFVEIQRRGDERDAAGQPTESWVWFASIWARIETINGREFIAQSGETAEATHRITGWWVPGVKPQHRVVNGDQVFDIVHVSSPGGRQVEIELTAREVVA